MKTTNAMAMNFGFSAVNAGQRVASTEPQLVAISTEGCFRITPPVSKALGVASGDYVMFLSNIDQIDAAISASDPNIVEFCREQGLEAGSYEAAIALHREFDRWAIAKGIIEYDDKGNEKTIAERLSAADRMKFVSRNFDEMLEHVMNNAKPEVVELFSREGISKDEQANMLAAYVKPRELPKFKGSKAASPAGLSGTGVSLNFTDTNVWKQMKADMGDDATKYNRVFDVNVESPETVEIYNGFEKVPVKALVLERYVDKEPVRITGKSE